MQPTDNIHDYKVERFREILEREVRLCEELLASAEQGQFEKAHRVHSASLKQAQWLLNKYNAVFALPEPVGNAAIYGVEDDA